MSRSNLAAVEKNGTLDSWNPDASGEVHALALSGGSVYAGGDFFSIGVKKRLGLAAISPTTGIATDWDPSAVAIRSLLAYPDGSLYVGGIFRTMDLAPQGGFASFSLPPVNTAPPRIVGGVHVGKQLACSKGSWSGSTPQTYAYAWLRDGQPIGGQTGATYVPKLTDAGHELACRVTARNLGGSSSASAAAVSVPPAPSATTVAASAITRASTTLSGSTNPNGETTSVYFQYGKTTAYGARTAAQNVGAGTAGLAVAAHVSGLTFGTTYHFRIVAASASGTAVGGDRTFKTLDACVVPKVKGKKLKAAKRSIRTAHCAVGKVRKVYSAHVKKGRVLSQKPRPRTVEPAGAKVKLVVSRGRKP